MFSSKFTGALAAAAVLLSGVVNAVPAPGPFPTPAPAAVVTAAHTAPTASAGTAYSTGALGTGSKNGTNATRTFEYTFSDPTEGFIIGCTQTTYVSVSSDGISAGLWCASGGVTLSTDLAIAQTTNVYNDPNITTAYNWTHVPNAYTGPSSGCSTVTTLDTSIASTTMTYCTCGNGWMGGLALGVSGTTSSTICQATATAMPSGYTQVPYGPGAPAWATPVSTGECATPTVLNGNCWQELDIPGYADWWWQENNKTCTQNEGFADCWFGAMTPYSPSNCSTLTGDSDVCKQPSWSDFEHMWNGARVFYLTQAISNLNAFMTQYYTAVGLANGEANAQLGNIITTIDPAKTTNVGLNSAMAALGAGLALIPGLGEGYALASGILAGVQQIPGLARYAFPQGNSEESQIMDWAQIDAGMGQVVNWLQSNISEAVTMIQTNYTNFKIVAGGAPYTGPLPPLNDLKTEILKGLYAYTISQAYNKTDKVLLRAVDTDVNALGTNGSKILWTPCNTGYYANGTCGQGDFWFDKDTTTSYGMVDAGDFTNRFASQTNQWLGLTDGNILFAGSDQCWSQHNGAGPIINFDGGVTSMPCIASIRTCTWTQTPASPGSDGNLMDDCDRGSVLGGYGRGSCGSQDPNQVSADPFSGTILPWAYLGWGMLTDKIGEHEFCEPYADGEF